MDVDTRYLIALSGTLVIELPLLALVARRLGAPLRRTLGVGIGANLFTHGTLWTVLPLIPWERWARTTASEVGVILVEGAIYAALARFRRPWIGFAVALGLNLASWLTGEVVWALL